MWVGRIVGAWTIQGIVLINSKSSRGIRFAPIIHRTSETMGMSVNRHLDATGLVCPEPVMLLHRAVREAGVGEVIDILASESSTARDVQKFCQCLRHELLEQSEEAETYRYHIRKTA